MKALLIAGGFGTRLRPLTYARPKHLLPIANMPHIEHVFELLAGSGVHDVVLLTSYLADAFSQAMEGAVLRGIRLEVAHEEQPLGTAGALKNAQDFVGDDTFLAFNGDILSDLDLASVLAFHAARGAEASIVLTPVEDPSLYGVVPTEADGRVAGFIEKPPGDQAPTNLINAGVYVMQPSVLDRIPSGEVYSAERQLFPELAEAGTLYATPTDAYWMDIGTPEKYLQANLDALAGRFATDAVPEPGEGAVLLADGGMVADSATIADVCVGAGAMVEDGATLHSSVLLPGSVVGAGAIVEDTILGERARVRPGARVKGATVADDDTCG